MAITDAARSLWPLYARRRLVGYGWIREISVHAFWAVAGRYEYYNDHTGFTTGGFQTIGGSAETINGSPATVGGVSVFVPMRQHVNEITGTLERKFAQHLITRAEYRFDDSNNSHAFNKGASRFANTQSTVEAGLIFVLEPDAAAK